MALTYTSPTKGVLNRGTIDVSGRTSSTVTIERAARKLEELPVVKRSSHAHYDSVAEG